ncbi:MAG: nicotinate phosphoribosyltransferase [Methanophagales archaeon]|nr:nicotinate phosphoribosyltransferase [Methanophagales archaeon]MCW3141433.1 nicotinate phosphoribosyltransferase [Methanophagales archaeon]
MRFSIVSDEDILEGKTTDIYFLRTEEVLKKKGVNPEVVAEVITTSGEWGVLAGLEEAAHLLAGKNVDVYAMPEGTIFFPYEPVLRIEGRYLEFARYETPLLGFLCHESGIATKASKIKLLAGEVPVISFGTRRQHPALAAMIERCAYLGGIDGVSCVAGAERIGIEATGTMPHSLIICFGEGRQKDAWKAFDEVIPEEVPRICLCDTYYDEKKEAIMAAEALGESLRAVRLDTPASRKGNFRKIIEEVRWELDIRGHKNVGIFVSGGIDEEEVIALRDVVAGFGVGTSIANARCIDFALDIIEMEGEPCAKRGKRGGKKQVYRRKGAIEEGKDKIRLVKEAPPKDTDMEPLLQPMIRRGKIVEDFPFSLAEARRRVLEQLKLWK